MRQIYGYDKTIQVGDYILAYHAGVHRLVRIERRFADCHDVRLRNLVEGEEKSPVFHYVKILDANLKRTASHSTEDSCDAAYCKKVTEASLACDLEDIIARYEWAIAYLFEDPSDMV